MVHQNIPTIHFILPGGGVKGAFQAGFIYHLVNNYHNYYKLYQVDCTSVGSLNGLALICDNLIISELKEIWFTINNIFDVFGEISNIPVISKFLMIYNSVSNKALMNSKPLKKKINNFIKYIDCDFEKYNCTVLNVNTGNTEYINGTNDNINKYILASASPWILSPPVEINNYEYSDAALLDLYPLKYLENSDATYKIIIGYNKNQFIKKGDSGDNIYTYLNRLMDISSNYSKQDQYTKIINDKDVILIENTSNIEPFNFDNDNILNLFQLGIECAEEFALKYLIN